MNSIEALVLGIIQGLTEFLPVSSDGHLQIGSALLGIDASDNLAFALMVHAATVLSTIVVLRKEIWSLLQGFFKFRRNTEMQFIAKLALSAVPVGIVGIFFKDTVENIFADGLVITGFMLLLTAAFLAFAYYAKPRQKENITFRDAFIIGIAQALAVLPGLSRSGTTISTGILLGNKKEAVTKFSFLMVLAPIMGGFLLDLIKGDFAAATAGISSSALLTGFIAAFVSGYIACSWMIHLVKTGKLVYFAVYCALAGTAVLIWQIL